MPRALAGGARKPGPLGRVGQQPLERGGERRRLRRHEQRRLAIEHLRVRQQIGRHDGLPRPEVRVDLERRIRPGDAGRCEDVGRLDEGGDLTRGLVPREDRRRPRGGGVGARGLDLLGTSADDEETRGRPRLRQDRHRRRAACPDPDTARTCPCTGRAAPTGRSPTRCRTDAADTVGGSSTSPPITFSMSTARSPAPIAST